MNSYRQIFSWMCLGIAGLCWIAVPVQAQDRRGGRWDPSGFLQRLDRNGDGSLDPEEMSGRSERFLQNMGIDTSAAVPISKILEKVESDRREADDARTAAANAANDGWSSPRLVPGFGETIETTLVPGFGLDANASSGASTTAGNLAPEVEASINEQVERVLGQFDENKNGILEPNEVEQAPWGRPSPQESDRNGDGILSRDELVERYRQREIDSGRLNRRDDERWRDARNSDNPNRGDSRDNSGFRSGGGGFTNRDNSSNRDDSSGAQPTETRTTSSSSSGGDRIASYVENLLKQYDKNFNGGLDSDELQSMRSAPKGADADGDGRLSRDELLTYYGGGYKSGSSSSGSGNSNRESGESSADIENRESSGTDEREIRRRESSRSSRSSVDGSRAIPMHEFSDEWDDEKLEEFYRLDLNRDGVITTEEFRKAGR